MADTPLPQIPETNIRKWIFIGGVFAIFFIIAAFFVFMSWGGGNTPAGKGFDPDSKQVSIWTVGLDSKIIADLNTQFNAYLGRSDMKLDVQNFTSFEDYIDILPRVFQGSTPPDIVMIPNHGGYRFFDQYVNSLGSNIVDFTDFETRFHKLFFEELVFSETVKEDGQDRIIRGLRGVPMGFEPMGIYYNRDLLDTVPALWDNLPESMKKSPAEITTPDPEERNILTVSSSRQKASEQVAFTNLGYGVATPVSPDILALLTIQKKWPLFAGYTSINSADSRAIFDYYLTFRRSPNNLNQFEAQFAETLTTTDLFVRGKIATIVWYPSTYQDIEIAIQRARQDNKLAPNFLKNLRVATILQEDLDPKKHINFAKYSYFALSKNGINRNTKKPSDDPVVKFVQFLLTEEAQNVFARHPTYMLPTQNTALTEKADTKINPDVEFSMTISDWYVPGQAFALYDMGIPHLYRSIIRKALDEPGTTATSVTAFVSSYLTCKIGQLTDPAQYGKPCLCQTKLPVNRNNYWPLCIEE
jgi:ABC-type glycerol-3-phosphate transport system substrate-binding protein